jgi:hypothetical protein
MTPTPSSPIIASVDRNETTPRRTAISLKIRLTLIDGSQLYVAENHVRLTGWIDYAYQWQTASHQLIIRWDNAHEVTGIATSPHHQHVGSEDNILPSEPMTLEKVLTFIASRVASD